MEPTEATLPPDFRRALLSDETSRVNKLHLIFGWSQRWFVEWKFAGQFLNSRLLLRFAPDGQFQAARSFEEDIVPTFELSEPKSKP